MGSFTCQFFKLPATIVILTIIPTSVKNYKFIKKRSPNIKKIHSYNFFKTQLTCRHGTVTTNTKTPNFTTPYQKANYSLVYYFSAKIKFKGKLKVTLTSGDRPNEPGLGPAQICLPSRLTTRHDSNGADCYNKLLHKFLPSLIW